MSSNSGVSFPLSISDIRELREEISIKYVEIIRNSTDKDEEIELFSLNLKNWLLEVLTLYTAETLLALGNQNFIDQYQPAKNLQLNICPAQSPFLNYYTSPLLHDPYWKKIMRFGKGKIGRDVIQYQPPFLNRPNEILTFSNAPLILKHAKEQNVRLIRNHITEWFKPYPKNWTDFNFSKSKTDRLFQVIKIAFSNRGVMLSDLSKKRLVESLKFLLNFTKYQISNLDSKAKHLPDKVWIGSAGIFHNRILAHVARLNGRHVCGHDHGTGAGWHNNDVQNIVECNYLDEFYTFTPLMAKANGNALDTRFLYNSSFKATSFTAGESKKEKTAIFKLPENIERKKILYVGTVYMKGVTDLAPRMFYDIAKSWHKNIILYLLREGFDVTYRPHPAEDLQNCNFISEIGAKIDKTKSILESVRQFDVAILDYSTTTAIVDLLSENIPIVLLDSGHEPLNQDGLSRIQNSLVYIPLKYDNEAKAILPKDLAEVIRKTPFCEKDGSFLEFFR